MTHTADQLTILATSVYPPAGAIAAVVGIGATICEFCEDYKHISNIKGSYQQLREAAKLATIFAVTAMASGLGAKLGGAAGGAIGDKVHQVSAAVENQIKDWKLWKSTCDWMKKNILDNAKAFTDDVKNLWDEAVVSKIKGWLDNTKAQLLYKKQNLKADDIYAELKNLVDEDALDYLQKEFYNRNVDAHSNELKYLEDMADCIKASQEALGKELNLDEVTYVNEEWGKHLPENAEKKQILKESIVTCIQNGKIYVKKRLQEKCKLIRAVLTVRVLREKGNVAVAKVDIPEIEREFAAHSKIQQLSDVPTSPNGEKIETTFSYLKSPEERIFHSYLEVKFFRDVDSEAKILEDIASKIKNSNVQGEIDLYTEIPSCPSCKNIMKEFKEMFPNITLNLLES